MIGKLGFGFLRLPKKGDEWDWQAINTMTDAFMQGGGTFFDTCYTYLNGISEMAIRKCVVERKPRESFQLCDKLPGYLFKSYDDCRKYFDEELSRCGVEWFDVLMLHWLNDENYEIAEKYDEFRFLREIKAEGKAKRIGFSYHGDAVLLDRILTAHPETDVVLMQLNYLDWESEGIQSRKCYEACMRHGKSVMVMEPVKGGTLASIPEEAEAKLRAVHPDWTPSDWALRFVQSLPGVEICLSGMGTVEQVRANVRPFAPLTDGETALLAEVAEIVRGKTAIGCTGCGYCLPHCPKQIPIPQYIKLYNEITRDPGDGWKITPTYHQMVLSFSKASDCIGCHSCEKHCPQKLTIADHMKTIASKFESPEG
ncbi:MAG: Fe-S oxidoreductase [Ruminococcaceae bacterium]|nr:Fe-S oxidoreductase [Oscillospiraceae bacterium]